MESYRTEEEQVEALKRWWQENGRSTIVSILLALGLAFGWQGWQRQQAADAESASMIYQQMILVMTGEQEGDEETVAALARQLREDYAASTYAQFAGLYLAQLALRDDDLATAEEQLRWVLGRADGAVASLARLRLARVLAASGETDTALDMLAQGQGGEMGGIYAIARGDVLMAAGRDDEARLAYDAAVSQLDPAQPLPETLREKIDFLNPREPGIAGEPVRGEG